MRFREPISKKLDNIESNLNVLNFSMRTMDREKITETMDSIREQLEQIRSYIELEPVDGHELNR